MTVACRSTLSVVISPGPSHYEQARELQTSRKTVRNGKNSTHSREYRLETQTTSSYSAMLELIKSVPASVTVSQNDGSFIELTHVIPTVTPLGAGYWKGNIEYSHKAGSTAESQNENLAEIGDEEISISFGTETVHITEALYGQTKYAKASETPPEVGNTIGDTGESVEGVDIMTPAGNITVNRIYESEKITEGWIKTRASKRCKVNSDTFLTFPPGELLFVQMDMNIRNSGDVSVSFSFSQRQNESNITVAGVPNVNKNGHQYMWVRYQKTEDDEAKRVVTEAEGVYVADVYESTDFNSILQ